MRSIALLFALTLAGSAFAADPAFADIAQADLAKAIEAKQVVVIDVNGSESWKDGHIPGAIDFAGTKDLATVLPSDKSTLIVAYCGGPKCGAWKSAATAASKLGYTNVKHYSGGISGWKEAKAPVEAAPAAK